MSKIINLHFAHANGFPAASYQQVFNAFPQDFSVLALRQFGHNVNYPVNTNLANLVDELIDYLHKQNSGPVYGVGHSMGALVTYMAACEAPELFKGVIMLDPPIASGLASWIFRLAKMTPLIDRISPAGKAQARCQSWPKDEDLFSYFSSKSLFKNFDPACIKDYVDAATKLEGEHKVLTFDAQVEAQIFRNVSHNIHQYYGKIQSPSCLVTAELSPVCVPRNINHFLENTKIEHIRLPSVGHMFPLETPRDVASLISKKILQWEQNIKKG